MKLREPLLAEVQRMPGATLIEISRAVGFPRTTVSRHLRALEEDGVVVGHDYGRTRRFFPRGMPPRLQRQIAALRRGRALELMREVERRPGIMQKRLTGQLDLNRRWVRECVDELVATGLLVEEAQGRSRHYYATDAFRRVVSRVRFDS